ncbi:MAG: serine hydrolase [Saprospiraceae bacterium]|nr:serine hydrolase [Saprospiraceae bacterium]
MRRIMNLSLWVLLVFSFSFVWHTDPINPNFTSSKEEVRWVDSVYENMTQDERLGQLFMIRAYSNKGSDHIAKVKKLIRDYNIGSLCFFQGTPEKQVELVNEYQAISNLPLMIAIDGEWGLGMRMKSSTISFPRQLMLGAIQDNRLIYEMGVEIAEQMKAVGVHVNFAPVADINNNPANPVINTRSFGEDRYNVTVKSYMYMKGMQDNGLMACAKHFPGHGDTDVDSHLDLPVINHGWERLDSLELYPFRTLIQHGIGSVMVAHLNVPTFDERANRPTTLSYNTVTNLLKKGLGFKGLIFTDGLGMKGVTKHFESGQVEAEAILAGNDVLVLPENVETARKQIKAFIESGVLSSGEVEESVKKILSAKYRLGLTSFQPLSDTKIRARLNHSKGKALKQKLIEHALTMVRNKNQMIPFDILDTLRMASLSIGSKRKTTFQKRLDSYGKIAHFHTDKKLSSEKLLDQLAQHDVVIVSLHDMSSYSSRGYGLTANTKQFIQALNQKTNVVLVVFGTPYALKFFDDIPWVLEAYEENAITQDVAAQALFGAIGLRGRLPVTASPKSRFNMGVETRKNYRLGYALPEQVGLSTDTLANIDKIATAAIDSGATPGCVVLVAKEGKVVFHKAYGHHTYERKKKVYKDDIFDLASITKIAAATLSVMHLTDKQTLNVKDSLGTYLSYLKGSNKSHMVLEDVMAHHAGLIPWIPFYEQTLGGSRRRPVHLRKFYRKNHHEKFAIPVTEKLFLRNDMADTIRQQIVNSDLRSKRNYRYSDLGFYMIADLVEEVSGETIDQYVNHHFYEPLGLKSMSYKPWESYDDLYPVLPTEKDRYFRKQGIRAYVHDMGAAMLGGVSGHAGLFSNATDLAILMQCLLQEGSYGGQQFLEAKTIKQFTQRHERSSRRGIGFDMLELDDSKALNCSSLASERTFGHLGFTGTAVWVDPSHDLVYIFLSNRTYPSMRNYKLGKMNIRPRIQTEVYKAMKM